MSASFFGVDKKPIVVEIGGAFVRCGFAGEARPRHVLPTAFALRDGTPVPLVVRHGEHRPSAWMWDEAMELFVHELCFKLLLVSPRERRFVLCENVMVPTELRNGLGRALFGRAEATSLYLIPCAVACLMPLEMTTGLVIDIGHGETRVLPVCDSYPCLAWQRSTPLAGAMLASNLGRLLERYAKHRSVAEPRASLVDVPDEDDDEGLADPAWSRASPHGFSHAWLQNVLPQLVFIAPARADAASRASAPVPQDFAIRTAPDRMADVRGAVRWLAGEVLFASANAADYLSIPEACLESLLLASPDMRGTLSQNIVVCGGLASLPGLLARLRFEVETLARANPRYSALASLVPRLRYVPSPFALDSLAWLGGSICGTLAEHIKAQSVTAEAYAISALLPDWSRLRFAEDKEDLDEAPL